MTNLNRPLVRRTRESYSVLYVGSRRARQIVIALLPGDVLEFRESGRRIRWHLPIETAFRYAVRCAARLRRPVHRQRQAPPEIIRVKTRSLAAASLVN